MNCTGCRRGNTANGGIEDASICDLLLVISDPLFDRAPEALTLIELGCHAAADDGRWGVGLESDPRDQVEVVVAEGVVEQCAARCVLDAVDERGAVDQLWEIIELEDRISTRIFSSTECNLAYFINTADFLGCGRGSRCA